MLTRTDYTNLWTNPAPGGFSQAILTLPSYDEYVIRENQLQDYLDIFRGRDTRGARPIEPPVWYYDHPFLEVLKANAGAPKIEYIMIGEAAPPLSPSIPGQIPDNGNSYFYNIHHGTSAYFTAPCTAFDIPSGNKTRRLLALARKGVLLLDIFPFATNYKNKFRNWLNGIGVTRNFWDGTTTNVELLINSLSADSLLHEETKLALVAPPTISHFIALQINLGVIILPDFLNCYSTLNDTIPATIPIPVMNWKRNWVAGNNLNGYMIWNRDIVTYFRCCTIIDPRNGPNADLIRNSFNL